MLGVVLLGVALVNLRRFAAGDIEPRAMLSLEIPLLVLGLLAAFSASFAGLAWAWQRKWKQAALALMSVAVFMVCVGVAALNGAAFLNAT